MKCLLPSVIFIIKYYPLVPLFSIHKMHMYIGGAPYLVTQVSTPDLLP